MPQEAAYIRVYLSNIHSDLDIIIIIYILHTYTTLYQLVRTKSSIFPEKQLAFTENITLEYVVYLTEHIVFLGLVTWRGNSRMLFRSAKRSECTNDKTVGNLQLLFRSAISAFIVLQRNKRAILTIAERQFCR